MVNLTPSPAKTTSSSPWIWLVLIATIALTAWTAMQGDETASGDSIDLVSTENTAEPVSKGTNQNETLPPKTEMAAVTTELVPSQALKRNADTQPIKDLFQVHSWVVIPPTPKLKPVPPPPPVAPPAPFTYVGKLENGPDGTRIFLSDNSKVYSIGKGENINSFWRLDSEDMNNINMTYIPLNLPQVLSKARKIVPAATPTNVEGVNQ
ncbi:MAG: hypothetical protein SFU55_08770 [Methylophilus sp.]|nr:hypothetical protein [Methylophilus sp.]